jgi:hypothetical protein
MRKKHSHLFPDDLRDGLPFDVIPAPGWHWINAPDDLGSARSGGCCYKFLRSVDALAMAWNNDRDAAGRRAALGVLLPLAG